MWLRCCLLHRHADSLPALGDDTVTGRVRTKVEGKLTERQLLGGGDAGQLPGEGEAAGQRRGLVLGLHQKSQAVVLEGPEDEWFLDVSSSPDSGDDDRTLMATVPT